MDAWKPRDISASFIEHAFSRSDHSVTVNRMDNKISAPIEEVGTSFTAPDPCEGDYADSGDLQWGGLWDWWERKISCLNDPVGQNILLTKDDAGGRGGDHRAVAGESFKIAEHYSSTQDYTFESAGNQVDTILEELAHAMDENLQNLDYGHEGDGGSNPDTAHDSGVLDSTTYGYAITPIGITDDTEFNNCGERVSKARWSGTGWSHRYSDCTEKRFEKP